MLKDYCGRGEEESLGFGGLPPEKCLRTTPSRASENAFLGNGVKITIIIDLGAQKENYTINLDMRDEQATLTLPLLLYAYIPTLEAKSNASAAKESQSTS